MRTVDQWNPLKVVFDMPHEADLKAAIMKFPLADRGYMVKEMLAYMGQFRGLAGWRPSCPPRRGGCSSGGT